ncbi:hypothetical protein DH2020_012312 [Rehmannia glutinosa]|uniref:Transmembrane protein n=1 Tax=Rehmannia glutinosa TaxID=99300 RepID=A0ABR0X0D2_REHGL
MDAVSKTSLLGACNLLMATLFALSTCFQFDDSDWYFWIPLYATACIVNLVNWSKPNSRMRKLAKFAFWLGLFLFIKVSIEDFVKGTDGFWSTDMKERIVREKFGSGLVIISMFLFLQNSSNSNSHPTQVTKYGMPILVGIAYGLSFVFFAFQHDEMKY